MIFRRLMKKLQKLNSALKRSFIHFTLYTKEITDKYSFHLTLFSVVVFLIYYSITETMSEKLSGFITILKPISGSHKELIPIVVVNICAVYMN